MHAHSSERSSLPGSGSVVALRRRPARARWNEGPLGRSEILALQRTAGNRAVSEMLTLQRAWAPAVTASKTTLRTGPSSGQPKVGGSLPVGTRVVADRAQQQVERRMVGANVTWTRAATVAPPNWTIAQAANVRYIRAQKLGADKVYPDTTNRMPIAGRSGLDTERRWSDQIGDDTCIELSPPPAGAQTTHTASPNPSF